MTRQGKGRPGHRHPLPLLAMGAALAVLASGPHAQQRERHALEGDEVAVERAIGRLEVKGHRGELQLRTGSGDVDPSDARGNVRLESGSGGARILPAGGGRVGLIGRLLVPEVG
jgi:hypothetical protein